MSSSFPASMSTLNPKLCFFLLDYFSLHATKPVRQKDLVLYNTSVVMTFVPIKLAVQSFRSRVSIYNSFLIFALNISLGSPLRQPDCLPRTGCQNLYYSYRVETDTKLSSFQEHLQLFKIIPNLNPTKLKKFLF